MKKTIFSLIFVLVLIIAPKVHAAGNVSLSANKTNVNIGEEFTVSISFSRCTGCLSYSKSYSRYF